MQTKIKITSKEISEGKKDDPSFCPIGLALSKNFKEVNVQRTEIHLKNSEGSFRAYLPLNAQSFIEDFDRGREVKEIDFNIFLIKDE